MTKKKILHIPAFTPDGKPNQITRDMVNDGNKQQGMKFRLRVKLPDIKVEKFIFVRDMDEAEDFVRKTGATLIEVKETDKMPTYEEYKKEKEELK